MNLLTIVAFALMGCHSHAIKVSVRWSACDNYLPEKELGMINPDGCLLVHYPERDTKDVAILTQGVIEDGAYTWNAGLGNAFRNSLRVRSNEDAMHLTFANQDSGKEQIVANVENGQEFDVDEELLSEDAKSMSLEQVYRNYDGEALKKAHEDGLLKIDTRQACGDNYALAGYCRYAIAPNTAANCVGPVALLCSKTCGRCDTTTTKAPTTTTKAPTTTTKAPTTTAKAPTTTAKAPTTTAKAPTTTAKAPTTTAKAPTTTAKAPTTTAKAPTTTAKAPTTTAKAPTTTPSSLPTTTCTTLPMPTTTCTTPSINV